MILRDISFLILGLSISVVSRICTVKVDLQSTFLPVDDSLLPMGSCVKASAQHARLFKDDPCYWSLLCCLRPTAHSLFRALRPLAHSLFRALRLPAHSLPRALRPPAHSLSKVLSHGLTKLPFRTSCLLLTCCPLPLLPAHICSM